MGGTPVLGLNVCMFPAAAPVEKLNLILKGASESAQKEGVIIAGGHTTKNDELHYGLSVYGTVKPVDLRLSSNAKPGDHIILTKGLGTGILFAAKDRAEGVNWQSAIDSMKQTSVIASKILTEFGCRCSTDITGFGFVPHLLEVLEESRVAAKINPESLPLLPGVIDFSRSFACPVLSTNMELAGAKFDSGKHDPKWINICFDAQTSGGFIAFVSEENAGKCLEKLIDAGYQAADVGEVAEGESKITLV